MISEKDYLRFAFPYEQRVIRAIREAGLVSILEPLGWIEPRLPHFARLEVDCLEAESSLKGYRNDVAEMRKVLGEEVCLFGNTRILQVIEQGTEEVWRQDAIEQARGVGEQRRYVICAGSPTTWATTPDRLRRFGEYTRRVLAEVVPPLRLA
jgi:uroporphyrinogen-III decarboxylase